MSPKSLLHLGERPGSLHVAEILPGLIFGVLNAHSLGWRGRLDDNRVERIEPGEGCGSPAPVADHESGSALLGICCSCRGTR